MAARRALLRRQPTAGQTVAAACWAEVAPSARRSGGDASVLVARRTPLARGARASALLPAGERSPSHGVSARGRTA